MYCLFSFKAFLNIVSDFPVIFGFYACPEHNIPDISIFQEFIDLPWLKGADLQDQIMVFDHGLLYQGIRGQQKPLFVNFEELERPHNCLLYTSDAADE